MPPNFGLEAIPHGYGLGKIEDLQHRGTATDE